MSAKLGQRHAEIVTEMQTLADEIAEAERVAAESLRQLAADVTLHEISETEGAKRRQAIVAGLDERREKLATLREALPEIERRKLAEEEAAHAQVLRTASASFSKALVGRYGAAKAVARSIRDLDLALSELQRHRNLVVSAEDSYRGLLDDGDFAWPDGGRVDEEWHVSPELLALLQAGPVAPLASAEAASAKAAETPSQQAQEALRWYAGQPSETRRAILLKDFPEMRERAEAIDADWDAKFAEQQARRRAREAERTTARF